MRIKKIQRPQIETTFNAVNDPWYSLNVKLPTKIFPFFLSCFRREREEGMWWCSRSSFHSCLAPIKAPIPSCVALHLEMAADQLL